MERANLENDMFRRVFDAFPSLAFVVDDDVKIQEFNKAAGALLKADQSTVLKRRAGDVLHCLHATESPHGCGQAPFCKHCVVRNSINDVFQGNAVIRRRAKMELQTGRDKAEIFALITASPFSFAGRDFALLVLEDISEMTELQRLIPICSVCRKVQDDKNTWTRVEAYFKDRWDVDFSHGLCPSCYEAELDKLTPQAPPRT